MNSINKQAHQLIEEWKTLLPSITSENQKRLDDKFRLEFNYNSNHIEGNTLTYGDTKLLLIFDETTGSHNMREYEEMKAHDVAYKMIREMAADKYRPLTESAIKYLNEVILVRPYWKNAVTADGQPTRRQITVGGYKTHPNSVKLKNGEMFEYASPVNTPIQMGELIQWFREEENKNELHPVQLAALLHYRFVCIHPFDDGNGRVARLLMNYVLLRNQLPPVIIQSKAKNEYLRALHIADSGNVNSFIEYISDQLIWSIDISIRAAKGLEINETDDLKKRIELFKQNIVREASARYEKLLPKESVQWVWQHVLSPLFTVIEAQLAPIEALFISRKTILGTDTTSLSSKQLNFTFEEVAANNVLFQEMLSCKSIQINVTLEGLTHFDNNMQVSTEAIEIMFHANEYEIKYNNSRNSVKKQYRYFLSEGIMQSIADTIGHLIIDNLESATS